jgi:hypothetical protein
MGIDLHALNFLRYVKRYGDFGKTLTLGRQNLDVQESVVRKMFSLPDEYKNERYCEELILNVFGASTVDSLDNSGYENATIIADMNQPLPAHFRKFNTIVDGGTLEHVFNLPQALKNVSLLCQPGGQIIHILPANNFCGHGFWQFSPELFFSLYKRECGYKDTEVFIADLTKNKEWVKANPPLRGQRVSVYSNSPLYVLVRTILVSENFSHENVQQSDYVVEWNKDNPNNMQSDRGGAYGANIEQGAFYKMKKRWRKNDLIYDLLSPLWNLYRYHKPNSTQRASGITPESPELQSPETLKKVNIATMLNSK